jgi:hypothetical protein
MVMVCGMLLVGCVSPVSRRVDVPGEGFPNSFTRAPYIHPRIIQDLTSWMSDDGDQVVAINLPDAQDSNRYFGEVHVEKTNGEHPFVYVEGDKEQFGYQYVGRTEAGVHVLCTSDWGGGSGVFKNLMFVVFERDGDTLSHPDRPLVDLARDRLLVEKLGEISLGDRYAGRLEVTGNRLLIGKDTGWFSVSGGTGGSGRTEDVLLRLDLTRQQGAPADAENRAADD